MKPLTKIFAVFSLAVLTQTVPLPGARAAEPVHIFAAGSLVGPLKDIIAASGLPAGAVAEPVFGPAGLLGERLEKGEAADLFLSADLAHPRKLLAEHPAAFVAPFARNKLCVLSRESLGLTDGNLVDKFLDPSVRLATSTPNADPGGDYAWAFFAKADGVHPGAKKTLQDKALQLMGSPNAMVPIAGKSPVASIFLADRADAMIYYCSGQAGTLRDVPGLVSRPLPASLDVTAVYGLALLSDKPDAQRLALFLLSDKGQAILSKNGLLPVLDETSKPAETSAAQSGQVLRLGLGAPGAFPRDKMAALPQTTQSVTQKTSHGEEATAWSGPLLWDVLTAAGLVDPQKHGEHAHLVIHATGRDGYVVTVALSELSPDFEGKQAIVADHLNGAALPDGALRLVVPGDRRAGRSVRDLVSVTVGP